MVKPKYKIVMIGEMLSQGGAERVQSRLSFFFAENNIDVHHIIIINKVTYDYAGTLFNLGEFKSKRKTPFNKLKRVYLLRKYLRKHAFDFIIDFRVKNNFIQEYIIANWIYKSPYIVSVRSFKLSYYFPNKKWFAKIIFKKAYGFVTVTKAIETKIIEQYKIKNTTTIYNPLDFKVISKQKKEPLTIKGNYIIGVGRMSSIKQFDHLIKAYKNSISIKKGIKLLLLGDGDLLPKYKNLVAALNIEQYVEFKSQVTDVFPFFEKAYFTVLTSKNEGFPNVLIESLATGTPVVSYNCKSGPNEIIKHRENGLLVKNQDVNKMADAINEMINNSALYHTCQSNAKPSVQHLSIKNIGEQWIKFMDLK